MRIGFTGTRDGMSESQKQALRVALGSASEFHHGDCIGADAEADAIARQLGIAVVIHPPTDSSRRAFCVRPGDVVRAPRPFIERNHAIVDESQQLIAAPKSDVEALRSGTWATVRYARRGAAASPGVAAMIYCEAQLNDGSWCVLRERHREAHRNFAGKTNLDLPLVPRWRQRAMEGRGVAKDLTRA